jgi:electron transfer flavoprotein alpha subunit
MNTIKRIDPRRPFVVTTAGLRRITLGEIGTGAMLDFASTHAAHHDAVKPRRTAARSTITRARRSPQPPCLRTMKPKSC